MNEAPHRSRSAAHWWRGLSGREAALVACGALAAAVALALVAIPAAWYFNGAGAGLGHHPEVFAALAELSALDARWERDALRMLHDPAPPMAAGPTLPPAAVPKRLERVAQALNRPGLQEGAAAVARAFAEKAGAVARFGQAHAASRTALRDALAMEAEIAGLLREAWRDAPDRQRLIAADNVVTQLFADIQRYYFAPAESTRKNLAASISDLRGAAEALPAGLKAATARLDHHINDLVRARPQELVAYDGVRYHNAGPRAATLTRELQLDLERGALQRARHRVFLAAYFWAVLVLAAYLVARLIRRELGWRQARAAAAGPAPLQEAPVEPVLAPPAESVRDP